MNVLIGQSEGLPEIDGTFHVYTWETGETSGAFSSSIISRNATESGTKQERTFTKIKFNASRSNSIYGASNNVTTVNLAIKYWKRIA